MKKVCVLLSTYNGEKFLTEQIDSLLVQKGVEIKVLARDDGSKDGTISILKSYADKDSRFSYYLGNNLGPAQSFFDLIKNSSDADYFAFCDQDDVWDEDKLECAVELLEKEDISKPNLYFSNLRIVDQDLHYYRLSHSKPLVQESKYSALTEDMATGCTVVFNDVAAQIARNAIPEYCSMHDTWMYMICKFFGTVVNDFNAHVAYRQHGNNVVGTYLDKKTMKLYVARIKRLFDRKLQPRYNNAKNFYSAFSDRLSENDSEKIKEIVEYKNSAKNRMRLFFDKEIRASSKSKDLRYRGLIIIGIV